MKNLVLALLIALGATNTNIAANTNLTTQVSENIAAFDLDSTEKTNILEWVKNHPILVGSIVIGTVAVIAAGSDYKYNQAIYLNKAKGFGEAGLDKVKGGFNATKEVVMHPVDSTKAGYNKSVEFIKAHPYKTAGASIVAAATLAVVIYAICDIRKTDDSKIKKAYKKLFGSKKNKTEAAA